MNVVFRVDASIQMGTGHVMRCLTLADALKRKGAKCCFICREHPGNLIATIKKQSHEVYSLPLDEPYQNDKKDSLDNKLDHANWLGTTQEVDADLSIPILRLLKPDWMIIDHYAIDRHWEKKLRPYSNHIMVIDDLADRYHDCDLLLDQTLGRCSDDYLPLVPKACKILIGSNFSMLRPEFYEWRLKSLERRKGNEFKSLLINLGGVDKDNAVTQILKALSKCTLSDDLTITVVMGTTSPYIEQVYEQARRIPWLTKVNIGVNNMAELMAESDLSIGAAGSTSWERCCLGLPSIVICLAENQKKVIENLEQSGAAILCSLEEAVNTYQISLKLKLAEQSLGVLSGNSANIVDGLGCDRVAEFIRTRS